MRLDDDHLEHDVLGGFESRTAFYSSGSYAAKGGRTSSRHVTSRRLSPTPASAASS